MDWPSFGVPALSGHFPFSQPGFIHLGSHAVCSGRPWVFLLDAVSIPRSRCTPLWAPAGTWRWQSWRKSGRRQIRLRKSSASLGLRSSDVQSESTGSELRLSNSQLQVAQKNGSPLFSGPSCRPTSTQQRNSRSSWLGPAAFLGVPGGPFYSTSSFLEYPIHILQRGIQKSRIQAALD